MFKSSISKNPELLILIYDVCLLNAFVFIGKIVIKSKNNIIDKNLSFFIHPSIITQFLYFVYLLKMLRTFFLFCN